MSKGLHIYLETESHGLCGQQEMLSAKEVRGSSRLLNLLEVIATAYMSSPYIL